MIEDKDMLIKIFNFPSNKLLYKCFKFLDSLIFQLFKVCFLMRGTKLIAYSILNVLTRLKLRKEQELPYRKDLTFI